MKKMKLFIGLGIAALAGFLIIAADHIDAPAVTGGSADITDFYAFQGESTDNIVFVANLKGLMSPSETANADFDENVLIEFNIDNDGDYIEDLVIQAIPKDGKMYFFGPFMPTSTGLSSQVANIVIPGVVDITPYGSAAIVEEKEGMMYFAGPRDDPFFFDFARYSEIIAGNASSFDNPGSDTFAGTNVLSIVVEVPKDQIGGTGVINTWVESKVKV
ncbi:MAG: DUF4331 family protein [Chitinophagales bacterium]|nr:DUF4331 family protein [Chitinophagales bacterium]